MKIGKVRSVLKYFQSSTVLAMGKVIACRKLDMCVPARLQRVLLKYLRSMENGNIVKEVLNARTQVVPSVRLLSNGEDLAMAGESTESVVQGVSTKDHEIGLKYRESGSLIEKGCTERTTISPETFKNCKGGDYVSISSSNLHPWQFKKTVTIKAILETEENDTLTELEYLNLG